jgi:hypothetical protein
VTEQYRHLPEYRHGTPRLTLAGTRTPTADRMALSGRIIVLAVVILALHLAGGGPLAAPHPSRSGLRTWVSRTPPVDIAFAGIRLAALLVGAYLLVVVLVAWVGEVAGHGPTRALARRLLPRSAHGLLALATGAAVLGGAMTLAPTAGAQPPTGAQAPATTPPTLRRTGPPTAGPITAPPTLRRLSAPGSKPAHAPTTAPAGAPGSAQPGPPTTSHTASPTRHTTAPTHASPPTRALAPSTHSSAPPTQSPSGSSGPRLLRLGGTRPPAIPATRRHAGRANPATHPTRGRRANRPARPDKTPGEPMRRQPAPWVEVAPGDSFWSIASVRVADAMGRTPTTQEVAQYWSRLIEANRDRLPVPGQPDLLFAGDRLRMPAVLPV